MSGANGTQDCPNCSGKETMMTYMDWKPHDIVSGECMRCGYFYFTQNGFMSKKALKERRKDYGMRRVRIFRGKNRMEKW